MKNTRTIIILLLIVLFFGGGLFYFWKRNQKKDVVFTTEKASVKDISLTTIATGSIIPEEEVAIRPNISGIVDRIFVKAGDLVKVGDPIARIKVVPNIQNVQSSRNGVARAKIELDNQQKIFDRQQKLFKQGTISANNFDIAKASFEQAKQSYISANENYQIVKTGTAKGLGDLANTTIKSTISGIVLDVPLKEGNQVVQTNSFNEGTLVASLADISKMIFKGKIDESEVGKIEEGMPINITIGAMPDKEFEAKLNYIAPKGETVNGAVQFDIEAKLTLGKEDKIRAGLSANASIILDKVEKALALSESLVQYDKKTKKPFVEVEIGEQQYERRNLELGISNGIIVEIKEGITEKDKIKIWNALGQPEKGKGFKGKKH